MNGYSKIKSVGYLEPSSMEFSDPAKFPEPRKLSRSTSVRPQITNQMKDPNNSIKNAGQDSFAVVEEDLDSNGDTFGPKLRRNSSVSSAYAVQSAARRALSMRRSSSVSERYCRIHDQSLIVSSPTQHDEDVAMDTMERTRSVTKKHSRSRILKACKKLFGL